MEDLLVDAAFRALVWLGRVGALVGVAIGAIVWLLASRAEPRRRCPRTGVRVWAIAIAAAGATLSAVELVLPLFPNLWLASGRWYWTVLPFTPLLPLALAFGLTLRHADASEMHGRRRFAHAAATLLFCFLCLVFVQRISLAAVFPFAGGEFHAMFAHTGGQGYQPAALLTWASSTLALGLTSAALVLLIPVRWWVVALVASGVGLLHWWDVVTWARQSSEFNLQAWLLLLTLPLALFAVAGFASALRRRARVSPVAIDSPAASRSELVAPRHSVAPTLDPGRSDEPDSRDRPHG